MTRLVGVGAICGVACAITGWAGLSAGARAPGGSTNAGSTDAPRSGGDDLNRTIDPKSARMTGEMLVGIEAVLQHRRADKSLKPSEREIRNFVVQVYTDHPQFRPDEGDVAYWITFSPRYAPGEPERLHGPVQYGRTLFYIVRKVDARILRWGDLLQEMWR